MTVKPLSPTPNYNRYILVILVALTAFRLVALLISPYNLHGDEAQYWSWSQKFDFGYFSKPPMIAWVIGTTTALFGDSEWAVRLSSPLIHSATTYLLYRTGHLLFDGRTGFWAACLYFLMPAVWLSSSIVSTDVVLLFFWTLALLAWAHMRRAQTLKWAAVLGMAIGLGMLSKYAMLFFIIALGVCMVLDPQTRKPLLSKYGVLTAVTAGLIISPNIYWNYVHDFATVSHTAANANLKGVPFHPTELLEFWGSQFAVFGPVTLGLLICAVFMAFKHLKNTTLLCLTIFTLCSLVVISTEALLSRANANWAVSAYISGTLLGAHFGLKLWPRALKFGLWFNVALGGGLALVSLSPHLVNAIGGGNSVKRVRGWPQTKTMIADVAKLGHNGHAFRAVATDNRLVFFDLLYYGVEQDTGLPLRMWLNTNHALHHAEAISPLRSSLETDEPILLVNYFRDCQDITPDEFKICMMDIHAQGKLSYAEKFRADFKILEELPPFELDLGGGKTRKLRLWAGYGYTPTQESSR